MLKPKDLNQFRSVLLVLKARIQDDIEPLEKDAFSAVGSGDHSSSIHVAEMSTGKWQIDFSTRIVENDQELLSEICLESGSAATRTTIPKFRLNTISYARNCMHCERKRE